MSPAPQDTIAVIGGGVMGEALIAGVLRFVSGETGTPQVRVVEMSAERARELEERYAVDICSASEAVDGANVVILAVKPQDMAAALASVASHIAEGTLVISIAAGVTTASLTQVLTPGVNVVRAMPNTPARIERGLVGISGAPECSANALDEAERVMSTVGVVVRIPEDLQDALTAVSGSGPAYLFYLAEKMTEAAIALGLDPDTARVMVQQTLLGSAMLLIESGEEPAGLRAKVTSRGGTTAAAIAELDQRNVGDAIVAAITAARDRGRELGNL